MRGFIRISPETKSSKIQKPDNRLFRSLFFGYQNRLQISYGTCFAPDMARTCNPMIEVINSIGDKDVMP